MEIAFVHGGKIAGLSLVHRLVQPSGQAVSHALRRDVRHVYKFNHILVTLALVYDIEVNRSECLLHVAPVWTDHGASCD